MAQLDRAIPYLSFERDLSERVLPLIDRPIERKIQPARVQRFDQVDFPLPFPMFDLFLPRDGICNQVEALEPGQTVASVPRGEAIRVRPGFMFGDSNREIGYHPKIECSVETGRHDVTKTEAGGHGESLDIGNGTVKLCHDGEGENNKRYLGRAA